MADQKISELIEKTTPVAADMIPIYDSEALATKKLGVFNLAKGRPFSKVIAASNAPANVKAQADAVCDQGRTNTVLDDCEDAWNEYVDTNVTSELDTTNKAVGSGSAKLTLTGVGADTLLATEVITERNLTSIRAIRLWLRSSKIFDYGDYQLLLDNHAQCVSPEETLNLQPYYGELIHSCEKPWTELVDADVTVSRVASLYGDPESHAVKFAVGAGLSNGDIIATSKITQISLNKPLVTPAEDRFTHINFLIKTSLAIASGDLQLLLDDTASCGSPLETINLPAISADTTTKVSLVLANPSTDIALISVGLKYAANAKAVDITIDNIRATGDWIEQTLVLANPASDTAIISVGLKRTYDQGDCNINIDHIQYGVGDDEQLQAANEDGNTGDVILLSAGHFDIEDLVIDKVTFVGAGGISGTDMVSGMGTTLHVKGSIIIRKEGNLKDVNVLVQGEYWNSAVVVDCNDYSMDERLGMLNNVLIGHKSSEAQTGTGLEIRAHSKGAHAYCEFIGFGSLIISYFWKGVFITSSELSNGYMGFVNSSHFESLICTYQAYPISFWSNANRADPSNNRSATAGWMFSKIMVQSTGDGYTRWGWLSEGVGSFINFCADFLCWDWHWAKGEGIYLTDGSRWNQIKGDVVQYADDSEGYGVENTIIPLVQPRVHQIQIPVTTDHTYSGNIEAGVLGEVVSFRQCCYYDATNSVWKLAKADAIATIKGKLGICVLAGNKGDTSRFLLFGNVYDETDNWTTGKDLFVSAATAGALVDEDSKPSGSGQYLRKVGSVNSADGMFFNGGGDIVKLV